MFFVRRPMAVIAALLMLMGSFPTTRASEQFATILNDAQGVAATASVMSWENDRPEEILVSYADGENAYILVDEQVWSGIQVVDMGVDPEGWQVSQVTIDTADGPKTYTYRERTDASGNRQFTMGHAILPGTGILGTVGNPRPMCLPCAIGIIFCIVMEELQQDRCADRAAEKCGGASQVKEVEASSKCGLNSSCKWVCR